MFALWIPIYICVVIIVKYVFPKQYYFSYNNFKWVKPTVLVLYKTWVANYFNYRSLNLINDDKKVIADSGYRGDAIEFCIKQKIVLPLDISNSEFWPRTSI